VRDGRRLPGPGELRKTVQKVDELEVLVLVDDVAAKKPPMPLLHSVSAVISLALRVAVPLGVRGL
jgi:hypothetical protein